MHQKKNLTAGKRAMKGTKTLIMVHGRGGNAEDILSLSAHLNVADFALLAPQAMNNTWYPYSFMEQPTQNEPWLSSALEVLEKTRQDLNGQGIPDEDIFFLGFSQGACLTLEFVTRNARRYGGVVAFTGGLIGDRIYHEHYKGDFKKTPVFIGSSDPDAHVPVERVFETVTLLKSMHANVVEKIYPNMGHTINQDEINEVNKLIFK